MAGESSGFYSQFSCVNTEIKFIIAAVVQERKENFKTGLTASEQKTPPAVPRPRLDLARVLECSYGEYPWDDWEAYAKANGVPEALASLGRATIREAYQHGWSRKLKSLCGWKDDGQRMVKLALRSPERAKNRWNRLLETDGNRGHYDEQTGEWVSHY